MVEEAAPVTRRRQDPPRQGAPAPIVPSKHGATTCTPPEGSSSLASLRGGSVAIDDQPRQQEPKHTIIRRYVHSVEMGYRARPANAIPHLPQRIIHCESPEYKAGGENEGVGGRLLVSDGKHVRNGAREACQRLLRLILLGLVPDTTLLYFQRALRATQPPCCATPTRPVRL